MQLSFNHCKENKALADGDVYIGGNLETWMTVWKRALLPICLTSPEPQVAFSCFLSPIYEFLSLPFLFMALTLLKSISQLFCRMPYNLGFSDLFLWLDWGYDFVQSTTEIILWLSYNASYQRHMLLTGLFTGDVNFVTFLRWCLLSFSTIGLLFPPCN